MSPTRVSAGGWPDLQPTLVLKNLGCEQVIYVTRRGDDSALAQQVAGFLGASKKQVGAYFSLDQAAGQPMSAALKSTSEADGVWCTNWNAFSTGQVQQVLDDTYAAPFERSAALKAPLHAYAGSTPKADRRGCTVGAPALPAQ